MSNIKIFVDEFGTKKYYLDGKLHRVDGPAVECIYGYKEWWVNGKLHRVDGPTIEWLNGTKKWYLEGLLHRVDGPAIEWADGGKEWWFNGKKMTKELWFENLSDDLRIKLLFDEYFMKG